MIAEIGPDLENLRNGCLLAQYFQNAEKFNAKSSSLVIFISLVPRCSVEKNLNVVLVNFELCHIARQKQNAVFLTTPKPSPELQLKCFLAHNLSSRQRSKVPCKLFQMRCLPL